MKYNIPTLSNKIIAYLSVNKITSSSNDFSTGIPLGEEDQILKWNDTLGSKPTQSQLDSAWTTFSVKLAWLDFRNERSTLLKDCDYTQLPDYNGLDKAAWATYRQALRDIPQNQTDPSNITWPVSPT
jgi:hypothetical protein